MAPLEIIDHQNLGIRTVGIRGGTRTHLLLVASHAPFKDPRIGWQVDHVVPGEAFICVGLTDDPPTTGLTLNRPRPHVVEVYGPRHFAGRNEQALAFQQPALQAVGALHQLRLLASADDGLLQAGHAIPAERCGTFRTFCDYFASSAERLVQMCAGAVGISTILAADLNSLLPAIMLAGILDVPVIYDAHEFWPESLALSPEESRFWRQYEQALAGLATARFAASAPTAENMTEAYGIEFLALPNAEPQGSSLRRRQKPKERKEVVKRPVFLFQGRVSCERGLENVIRAWQETKSNAQLLIRGPVFGDGYADELRALAGDLWGDRVSLTPPVSEAELVAKAWEADVGIIPYEPVNANNLGACPNKLSQYMASGIAILSNNLPFIAQTLKTAKCGVALDFSDAKALAQAVDTMAGQRSRTGKMGRNGQNYHFKIFNWEAKSKAFYKAIAAAAGGPKGRQAMLAIPVVPDCELEFAALQDRYGLREVFPVLQQNLQASPDGTTVDLRNHGRLDFVAKSGGRMSATVLFPLALDLTHAFVRFESAVQPIRVRVEGFLKESTRGEATIDKPPGNSVLLALPGNLCDSLRIELMFDGSTPDDTPGATLQCLSYGICAFEPERHVEALRAFEQLKSVHGLREIFPCMPYPAAVGGPKQGIVDLRQAANVPLTRQGSDTFEILYLVPSLVDVTHVLLELQSSGPIAEVVVEGMLGKSVSGAGQVSQNSGGVFLVALAGNLTDRIRIIVRLEDGQFGPPLVRNFRAIGLGLVPEPSPPPADG